MNKKFFSKIIILAMFVSSFGLLHMVNAYEGESTPTGATIDNTAPVISVAPSDGSSSASTPTYAGDNVTFTVTATDANNDGYYLAICKTDAITESGSSAAPTCTGGEWVISSTSQTSGVEESITYLSLYDDGSQAWWAFACDDNSGLCSSSAQGSGDSGSPFVVDNHVPAFTVVTDDSSTGASPTNEGSNVAFTATASDDRGDQYYLAVCKTDSITPASDAAPSCAGGEELCISVATNSASPASCNWDTTGESSESVNWYSFVCDKNTVSGGGKCSSSETTNSPLEVNHAPTFGAVYVNPTDGITYSDANVLPNDTVYFNLKANGVAEGIDDTDVSGTQDTVTVRICVDATANYAACTGGAQICEHAITDPSTTAFTCNSATLATAPYSHGTKDFEVFVQDGHGMDGTGTAGQTFAVTDVAPVMGVYSAGAIVLTAGTSTDYSFTVVVSDNNGDDDVTSVDAMLFNDTDVNPDGTGLCPSIDETQCYDANDSSGANGTAATGGVDCTVANDGGVDIFANATCYFQPGTSDNQIWFLADDTLGGADWRAHANAHDETSHVYTGGSGQSDTINVNTLAAIGVQQTTIAYGSSLTAGGTSSGQTTTLQNLGNVTGIDVQIYGSTMTGPGVAIPIANQHFHHTTLDFSYTDVGDGTGGGDWKMVDVGTVDNGTETVGCLNRNIPRRTTHAGTGTDEPIYWKIKIPVAQASGTYSGSNTFTAAAPGACTGASN